MKKSFLAGILISCLFVNVPLTIASASNTTSIIVGGETLECRVTPVYAKWTDDGLSPGSQSDYNIMAVLYDSELRVTLNNLSLCPSSIEDAGLEFFNRTKLYLEGKNYIEVTEGNSLCGIHSDGSLSIHGPGTLEIIVGDSPEGIGIMCGSASNGSDLVIDNASLNIFCQNNSSNYGIVAGKVDILSSTIQVICGKDGHQNTGIEAHKGMDIISSEILVSVDPGFLDGSCFSNGILVADNMHLDKSSLSVDVHCGNPELYEENPGIVIGSPGRECLLLVDESILDVSANIGRDCDYSSNAIQVFGDIVISAGTIKASSSSGAIFCFESVSQNSSTQASSITLVDGQTQYWWRDEPNAGYYDSTDNPYKTLIGSDNIKSYLEITTFNPNSEDRLSSFNSIISDTTNIGMGSTDTAEVKKESNPIIWAGIGVGVLGVVAICILIQKKKLKYPSMVTSRVCVCGTSNRPDAKFCRKCGKCLN